ncbi:MAG: molybdopterin-dependent oxidoreductase [Acidimicrobiia bacterium]|nr:molybdopterin-dependent oxidoreductase [Acidimicrobiia bacterium]
MFSGRRTNLALLTVLGGAFISGLVVQALGTAATRWLLVVHGAIGISVMVLSPWKTRVADRGLGRRNRGRYFSLLLALMAVTVIVTGLLHTTGTVSSIGGFTVLWVHVATALALIPLLVWHFLARKTYPRRVDLARRNLLSLGGVSLAGLAMWFGADRLIRITDLAGKDRRFTGSHETSSFEPAGVPVTSWLDDRVPTTGDAAWRVDIDDAAGARSLTLSELQSLPFQDITADLDCTSGWWSRQVWEGVRLTELIDRGEARSIVAWSATGYARRYSVSQLDQLWLVTTVGGEPLSPGHGFPARIVSPNQRGFWWVKWVVRIETSRVPWWVQLPYPPT